MRERAAIAATITNNLSQDKQGNTIFAPGAISLIAFLQLEVLLDIRDLLILSASDIETQKRIANYVQTTTQQNS